MDAEKMYQERKTLFDNAIHFRPNERVPLLSNFYTWKILDAGEKLSAAMTDYSIMEKVVREFHERYCFDFYTDVGLRNPKRISDAMGAGYHVVNDELDALEVIDHVVMQPDEYQLFKDNPGEFFWNRALQRWNPNMTEGQFLSGVKELFAFLTYGSRINQILRQEYGLVLGPSSIHLPMEMLFNAYRGIKGLSIDLRKRPDEVLALIDSQFDTECLPALTAAAAGANADRITDTVVTMLAHTILSPKQFEKFYWPQLNRILSAMAEKEKTTYLFIEGYISPLSDFFRDIPKGLIIMHPEQDDLSELRGKLPNICLCGGMKSTLLGNATPEACVEYAKKLIDSLGDGFILSQDKMMSFRTDCKRENLLAVNQYVLGSC